MRIAILGTGAMGSIYAGMLAEAGHEVWAVDTWRDHVAAIGAGGLRLSGASGDRVVTDVRATSDASEVGVCDLVIVATKANQVETAVTAAGSAIGPSTVVVAMQNGLGAGDRLRRVVPEANIILGVAEGFGASMRGPGHVHHSAMKLLRFGELDGGLSRRLHEHVAVWNGAGFEAKAYADVHQLIWEKLVCNTAFSGPCTVFGRTVDEMMADADTRRICLACGTETYVVGQAKGIGFTFMDPVAHVTEFARNLTGARPSMLLDHIAQRKSEIDAINGAIPGVAEEVGMEAPVNQTIAAIVRDRERGFD